MTAAVNVERWTDRGIEFRGEAQLMARARDVSYVTEQRLMRSVVATVKG